MPHSHAAITSNVSVPYDLKLHVRRQPCQRPDAKWKPLALKASPHEQQAHLGVWTLLFPRVKPLAIGTVVNHVNAVGWETVMFDDLPLSSMRIGNDCARTLR